MRVLGLPRFLSDFYSIVVFVLLAVTIILVLCLIWSRKRMTQAGIGDPQESEYQRRLRKATEGLYENIFELDVTHDRAYGDRTKKYFRSLGIHEESPYGEALTVIAQKQISPEYIEGYLKTFSPENVIKNYKKKNYNLSYEFMFTDDGKTYRWMRIAAQIFFWKSDQSIHMITYRQNIDAEKNREILLIEKAQRDSLTGLYNKKSTEDLIERSFRADMETESRHALFLFDIDNFKAINDNLGHGFGDFVLTEFAAELRRQFRDTDILGRIGGDEFVVLMKNCGDNERVKKKLTQVCEELGREYYGEKKEYRVSASIGAAIFPEDGTHYAELYEKADKALYFSKAHGKNTFDIYDEKTGSDLVFRANEKDMKALMDTAADGISKVALIGTDAEEALTKGFKMLYFDERRARLTQTPLETLRNPNFDLLSQFYPADVGPALAIFNEAMVTKEPFTVYLRLRHADGHYIPVRLRGFFVDEKYDGKYPVFYALYSDLTDILEKTGEGKFLLPIVTD